MRFACIEYTTKTGKIWRHTPERPNYLCDPQSEIDPTSFACYTSALDGEHIPLSGLMLGAVEHPPSTWQRIRHELKRRTGVIPTYDIKHLEQFEVLLVIYQLTNDRDLLNFVERVRSALPHIIVVNSSSPPFGRLREHWKGSPDTISHYRAFLDATHFTMNVCRATVPFTRALTKTPVFYLPQPYPVPYALARAAEAQSQAPVIYVAGDTVRPDIVTGQLVAKTLQQRHPELLIRVTKTPGFALNTEFLRGTRFEVVPFRPWAEQLKELKSARLVINTDLWWTRGRVPVDCAAAGVPCVGTTSDGQTELWPELAVSESLHFDQLTETCERIISDEAFRTRAVVRAQQRLAAYAYEPTVQRFTHAVKLIRNGTPQAWQDPEWRGDTLVLPGMEST